MKTEPSSEWERYVASEPFFTVLTHPQYLRANMTPHVEAVFLETGEEHVTALLDFIRCNVDSEFAPRNVLEFGCGPGRLAIPLARRFPNVVAVDISPSMLDTARNLASRFGVDIFFQTLAEFITTTTIFDFVNCHFVLQRVTEKEGHELLRLLLDRVRHVGVIQLPYRDHAGTTKRVTRALRAHVPGLNTIANVTLRKKAHQPLQTTSTYDLNDVLETVQASGFDRPQLVLTQQRDYDDVTLYVRRTRLPAKLKRERAAAEAANTIDTLIDVRDMLSNTTIESLNATAEAYFAGLVDWEHHIIKPFSKPDETPTILINLAVLLQGLNLTAGTTVLDFGAGTGWLARFLTQLGCRAILVDVSASALKIARETFERIPIVGARPEPQFLQFEGVHIDVPDASVDRIVCFDAFHHAPNPDDVLREFARIVKPGGIVGFAEPGPRHSQTAQSQFEMRTYGVLENDVDVHAIWRTAQAAGFTDIRLAAYTAMPFHVQILEYDDLLAGGETLERWTEQNRKYLMNVRNFFLFKGDSEPTDSRHPLGLRAHISVELVSQPRADTALALHVAVTNVGRGIWLPSDVTPGGVSVGCHLYDESGTLLSFDFAWFSLSEVAVMPGQAVDLSAEIQPLDRGSYRLEFDCVAQRVTWFAQVGSPTTVVALTVT